MKTISLELSKRLAPYLEWVETEWRYSSYAKKDKSWWCKPKLAKRSYWWNIIKTLILEEAIEFLSKNATEKWRNEMNSILLAWLWDNFSVLEIFNIKLAEKMLEYLLINWLLDKKD